LILGLVLAILGRKLEQFEVLFHFLLFHVKHFYFDVFISGVAPVWRRNGQS
jgi:hypothetical protein